MKSAIISQDGSNDSQHSFKIPVEPLDVSLGRFFIVLFRKLTSLINIINQMVIANIPDFKISHFKKIKQWKKEIRPH